MERARNVRSFTVIDIAKLAGVSTATVSRVVNGSGTVSREAKKKVLSAISGLQYCPNNHAAELGRGNRGIPRRRGVYAVASSDTTAKLESNSGPGCLDKHPAAGQLHLLKDENSRLRRLIAELRLDLELLKQSAR
jgi:DNA-binding LacI/PurR family transcriptional regulator